MTEQTDLEKLANLVEEIKSLDPELEKLTKAARVHLSTAPRVLNEQVRYLRLQILAYSMLRIRHFIQHNLINNTYIETMATLAVCRYTFELVVWLKLMEKDSRFALLFNRESANGHLDNANEQITLLKEEKSFYISQAETERKLHQQAIEEIKASEAPPEEMGAAIARRMEQISEFLDKSLDSRLLVYYEEIKEQGYEYVAQFIDNKALPPIEKEIQNTEKQLADFEARWAAHLQELKDDKEISRLYRKPRELRVMLWKACAEFVGMETDYAVIYSYTSRLLHATPSSVMTLQQNLSEREFLTFWRYIRNQFRWIANLGSQEFLVLDETDGIQ
jgi:hypothetical protein